MGFVRVVTYHVHKQSITHPFSRKQFYGWPLARTPLFSCCYFLHTQYSNDGYDQTFLYIMLTTRTAISTTIMKWPLYHHHFTMTTLTNHNVTTMTVTVYYVIMTSFLWNDYLYVACLRLVEYIWVEIVSCFLSFILWNKSSQMNKDMISYFMCLWIIVSLLVRWNKAKTHNAVTKARSKIHFPHSSLLLKMFQNICCGALKEKQRCVDLSF